MTSYRRSKVAGGSYFFTLSLAERRSTLLVERIDLLREAIRTVRARHPFEIDAMVVLPDHLHCIWTLPENDSDYATRWSLIKGNFSRAVEPGERRRKSRIARRERGIWQRRFWEHAIRDETDYNNHVAYIHINPVKHGHVARAVAWPHSSIHRHIEKGLCDPGWAAEPFVLDWQLE
jgi:putative transposase